MQNSCFQVGNELFLLCIMTGFYKKTKSCSAYTNGEDAPCWTDGGQLGGVYKKLDFINIFNIRLVFKLTSMQPSAKAQHKPEEPRLTYWT